MPKLLYENMKEKNIFFLQTLVNRNVEFHWSTMNSYHTKAYTLLVREYSFLYNPPIFLDMTDDKLKWNKNKRDLRLYQVAWTVLLLNGVGLC